MSRSLVNAASDKGLVHSRTSSPTRTRSDPAKPWRLAWLLLTIALAAHVLDEALNDFLSVYNPAVATLRDTAPWLVLPSFSFGAWITGLGIGILVLAALTPLARGDRPWMRRLSYVYGIIMTLNGLGHLGASFVLGRWIPGVVSSPFLLAAALFLLVSVPERPRPATAFDPKSSGR